MAHSDEVPVERARMTAAQFSLIIVAFAIGASMARASLCSVACLQQLLVERRTDGILRLGIAISAAGLMLLTLAATARGSVRLPLDPPVTRSAIAGGVLLGVGSIVNGGCYLGALTYVSRGNLTFLLTFVGLLAVLRHATGPMRVAAFDVTRLPMSREEFAGLVAFALLLLIAAVATRRVSNWSPAPRSREVVTAAIAAALTGLLAGLFYASNPNWNYTSILGALAIADRRGIEWSAQIAALALLVGAILSSVYSGCFQLQRYSGIRAARCLAGGAIMGLGALKVPGGHDLLLLWSVPGLARSGAVAYSIALITVSILLLVGRAAGRT